MIAAFFAKIFGTKNDRELKRIRPIVEKINSLEPSMQALTDSELAHKTHEFKERLAQGQTLDDILPEAFAVVREAGVRTMGMRHFDVQMYGGIVLHEGKIAEMRTGEGKTYVATLPLYLNALTGKGAHLVTVNDYLVQRDANTNKPLYNFLGLEVGIIQNNMSDEERKKAYAADITYGTNNEYGFDYLRDNMKFDLEDYVQRDQSFVIVDEVDSILIDEARTPLIISGASERGSNLYEIAKKAVQSLEKTTDYEIDEKARSVHLTEIGNEKVEKYVRVDNLYAPENILMLHHILQALKAETLFKRDVEYVVRDGEVLIVDEFTGRILSGRRYSDGLHQAIEAKEGVKIERENQTLASITLQNFFRLFKKLAGMTGTAVTEAGEFHKIYNLGVVSIPTHRPMIRDDQDDAIFLNKEDKFEAVIEDIIDCKRRGQPVLVGTVAVETSEYISILLQRANIPHNVLNAKQHAREADIIKEAGEEGRVTIATNMAGRGTDIKLSEASRNAGGLRIIGTERHESRRIDNQLRGRSGRQGDPGSSKFYLSLDDDLIRIFAGDRLKVLMERFGMKPGERIEHRMVSKRIEGAQERVEKNNFDYRKHLLEYDDVLNRQRMVVYDYRRQILDSANNLHALISELIDDITSNIIEVHTSTGNGFDKETIQATFESLAKVSNIDMQKLATACIGITEQTALEKKLNEVLQKTYTEMRASLDQETIQEAEKWILLETVDHAWKRHLQNIDHLKEGIGLRGYGQKNPLTEYKKESFYEFQSMMNQIKWDAISSLFRMQPEAFDAATISEIEKTKQKELNDLKFGPADQATSNSSVKRQEPKVGRNDPCSCGSEKKYKHCCGE